MMCRRCGGEVYPPATAEQLCYACWVAAEIAEYHENYENGGKEYFAEQQTSHQPR